MGKKARTLGAAVGAIAVGSAGLAGFASPAFGDAHVPSGCKTFGTSFDWGEIGTPTWCQLANDAMNYDRAGDYEVAVQRAVADIGYYTAGIDGIYGSGTQTAVKAFQDDEIGAQSLGMDNCLTPGALREPCGVTGWDTWDMLNSNLIFCTNTGTGLESYKMNGFGTCGEIYYAPADNHWYEPSKSGTQLVPLSTAGPST
jgi:hypothetical protein